MKGTIIYYGGFSLPDKNAAANRVVSNGKIFDALGYRTVFLGAASSESFSGIKNVSGFRNMFEESHPETSVDWIKHIFSMGNLKKLVKKYNDVKLIILYNVPFVTLCIAKRFFKKSGITVAYDCTEWTKYTDGSFLKKMFKLVDEFFVRKFAHKVADKMIVISRMMELAYKKNRKLLRLPPLVDINDEIWNQKIEKNKDAVTFCFAGFPDGNKDSLDKVVEAFQLLNKTDIILNIVGVTQKEFEKIYPNISVTEENNICFLGQKTHKETIKKISECDCYIFIRQSDRRNNAGFPTKFVESYTCGVPIITTDVSDIKEYIKYSKESVLLKNATVESIKNAMLTVLQIKTEQKTPGLNTAFHYNEYNTGAEKWLND